MVDEVVVLGVAFQIARDERAQRHNPQTAGTDVVDGGGRELAAEPLALERVVDLGVDEDDLPGPRDELREPCDLAVDEDLVTVAGFVQPDLVQGSHAIGGPSRETAANVRRAEHRGCRTDMSGPAIRARAMLRASWRAWVVIAVVFGLLAGLAAAFIDGARRTDRAYGRFVRQQNAADLVMAGKSGFGLVGSVNLDSVEQSTLVTGSARAFVGLPFSGHTDDGTVLDVGDVLPVASVDTKLGYEIERWKMLRGHAANPARADEGTASFELARRLHLHVGSVLHFHFYRAATFGATALALLQQWPQRLRQLAAGDVPEVHDFADGPTIDIRITGIEASPLEFPPLINDLAPVVHLTPAFARRYQTVIVGSPIAYMQLRDRADLQRFQLSVERLAAGQPVSFISTLENQMPKVQRSIRAEALILTLLGVLVALAAAVALAQALVRQTFAESADDPTLCALGMSRAQRAGLALVRAGFVAVVAAVVAVVVAWALSSYLLLSLARIAAVDSGFPFPARVLGIGVPALVGYTLLVGATAGWLADRSHRRAPRPAREGRRRRPISEEAARAGAPISAVIGLRFATRRTRRSAPPWTAIAGVAACVAILALTFTFTAHLHRGLTEKERYGWNWDLKIGAPALPDLASVLGPGLRAQPGMTDVSGAAVTQVDVGDARVDVFAIDTMLGHAVPTLRAGDMPTRADEIAAGARTMSMLHMHIGDQLRARIGSRLASYTIVGEGVFPEFGDAGQLGTGFTMTVEGLHRLLPSAPEDAFLIRLRGSDRVLREARIAAALEPLPSLRDARPEDLVNLAHGDGLLVALSALLGLLALAMLVHALLTGVRGGRRDHAVLRALGFTRRQTRRTVRWQSLTLAVAAFAMGVPVGVVAGRALWIDYANHLGVAPEAFVPLAAIAIAGIGTIGVAGIAAVLPAWLAGRERPAIELRAPE